MYGCATQLQVAPSRAERQSSRDDPSKIRYDRGPTPDTAKPRRAERIQHEACGQGAGEDARRIGKVLAECQSGGLATPLGAGKTKRSKSITDARYRDAASFKQNTTGYTPNHKKNLKKHSRNTTDKTDHPHPSPLMPKGELKGV